MVSIIIPMYNCESYIRRCLDSLIKQTYSNVEIIVVDDGSKDNSATIVKEIQLKSKKIIYIYQENSGPGVARNKAIEVANGKYLLFVDSDDYLSDNYVTSLVKSAEKNNSELVVAGYTWVYENRKKDVPVIPKKYVRNVSEEWAYRISSCCSRMYLREFWNNHHLKFSEERDARAEDVPLVLYANVMAKNISIVSNAGYYYYQHSKSAMNSIKKRILFEFPYDAFQQVYEQVCLSEKTNSESFFYMGVLKFLAYFELVIYRRASKREKEIFRNYIEVLLRKDFRKMVNAWRKVRYKVELPAVHKIAIEVFILKHRIK